MEIGDRVVYTAKFLRSINAHTGRLAFDVGTVMEIVPCGVLTLLNVLWDGHGMGSVNAVNVILESKKHLEAV